LTTSYFLKARQEYYTIHHSHTMT